MGDDKKKWKKKIASTGSPDLIHNGKLPPQAVELEAGVLGALMLDRESLSPVLEFLNAEKFYKEAHQLIFAAICNLYFANNPVDILSVSQELRKMGKLELAGGSYYLTQLTNRVASAANVEYHARIVLQMWMKREMIRVSMEGLDLAYDETSDVFDIYQQMEEEIFGVTHGVMKKSSMNMLSLVTQMIKNMEVAAHTDTNINVPSGFTELDRVTNGWNKTDLIIVAARPAMGKTAFVMTLVRNCAIMFNKPVAVFSIEMSSEQLTQRLVSSESEIPLEKIKQPKGLADSEWAMINTRCSKLISSPIYIDDTPALNLFEFKAKARRLVNEHHVELIAVDYLQLMVGTFERGSSYNRETEVSLISRTLKATAKELNVPIIALSQLSRKVESRGNKRPQLSDLRESGAIEQDADMVLFIHRPEYYGDTEGDMGVSTEGLAEIIVAKNRNGSTTAGDNPIKLGFEGRFTRFVDFDRLWKKDDQYYEQKQNYTVNTPNPKAIDGDAPF